MQVIDYDMPYDQFVEIFDGIHAEWVDGIVYQLPKRTPIHDATQAILHDLFQHYVERIQNGQCLSATALLKSTGNGSARCPDLQVLIGDNIHLQHGREVIGAPDLVVEIISDESHVLERGEKFVEYERGGIHEYWIIDPIREECLFYVNVSGYFQRHDPDQNGIFHSTNLANLRLPVDFLWSNPSPEDIVDLINHL